MLRDTLFVPKHRNAGTHNHKEESRMLRRPVAVLGIALLVWCVAANLAFSEENRKSGSARETVLDRKIHIEEKILDVPQVPPLCNSIDGLTKDKIDIGNCHLYCEQEGKGTPLVVVSGGPGCTHHIFHPHFSRAAEHTRVIYYDQRGVGQSDYDPTGKKYKIKQAVEDLENLRKALKIEKWVVLGHSYGGFLAQCYALEHPETVLGLVLVCAATGMPNVQLDGTRQYDFLSSEERTRRRSIYGDDGLTMEQIVYNAHLNGDWKRQCYYRPTTEELARMAQYEWRPGPQFQARMSLDMGTIDLEGTFTSFDIPTLILESKWDLTWNTDKPSKMLKNHPGAKMVVFECSGHVPFADEPDRFFVALSDFVKTARSVPAPQADRMGTGVPWPKIRITTNTTDTELQAILNATQPDYDLGKESLNALSQAERLDTKSAFVWMQIATQLCVAGYYEETLSALERSKRYPLPAPSMSAILDAWEGIALDAMGRRQEAVSAYTRSLEMIEDHRCDTPWFSITHDWVQQRLETPFSPSMIRR